MLNRGSDLGYHMETKVGEKKEENETKEIK